jgi:hypothetical protein
MFLNFFFFFFFYFVCLFEWFLEEQANIELYYCAAIVTYIFRTLSVVWKKVFVGYSFATSCLSEGLDRYMMATQFFSNDIDRPY